MPPSPRGKDDTRGQPRARRAARGGEERAMARGSPRRKDREMAAEDVDGLLGEALVGRVGTVDAHGMPYVVPLNFVYDRPSRTVFLHCATSGHLLENLANNPRVCFEVDEPGEIIATGPDGCSTSQVYRSVIAFGTAAIVQGREEKEAALRLFVQKYVDRLMPERQYDPSLNTTDATTVIAVRLETATGKSRPPLQ